MEDIIIKVDEAVAKKWETTPEKVKEVLSKIFEKQIDESSRQIQVLNFKAFLDKIGAEAQAIGLTEEILQELLKEDE